MSDINDDYVSPDEVSLPDASYEVVQETFQPPTASIESIKASEQPQASVDRVQLSDPDPSHEQTHKGI